MHVCVAVAPFFYFERIHPPLALGYMATIAKERGHTCDTLDLRMRLEGDVDQETRDRLRSYGMVYFEPTLPAEVLEILGPHVDVWADDVAASKPDVLGISCFRPTRVASIALARAVKERSPGTFVVFGGPDCSLHEEEIMECEAIDGLVAGEGEEAFGLLLDALEKGTSLSDVPNLTYREGSTVVKSTLQRRPTGEHLVIPDFSGLPIPEYFASRPDKPPILPILWQRGCVANCSFCNARSFFPKVEARSPESVLEEMHSHYERYGVNVFEFYDLALNNYARELRRLCQLLIQSPVKFQWFGMMRFTKTFSEEFIKMMAAAGCVRGSFGLESGSPEVLRHMRKNTNMQLVSDILRAMHANGIDTHCTIIVGYPTETEEDFQMTVDFLRDNQAHLSSVNCGTTCSIKPQQPLWAMKDEMGIKFDENGDWYLGDNVLKVRVDRLTRLNAAVREMSFQRSQRFDAFTDDLASRTGLPSPNIDLFGNPPPPIQEWPVRTVSMNWSVGDGDAC